MDRQFVVPEEYRNPKSVEIAVKLLEYYLENKDSYNKGIITYGELCKKLSFEMNPRVIERNLGDISFTCKENGLPPISALVVNKDERMPGAVSLLRIVRRRKAMIYLRYGWISLIKFTHTRDGML